MTSNLFFLEDENGNVYDRTSVKRCENLAKVLYRKGKGTQFKITTFDSDLNILEIERFNAISHIFMEELEKLK